MLAQLQISDDEISRASAELKSGTSENHASAELALADGECSSRRRSSVMELMRQVSIREVGGNTRLHCASHSCLDLESRKCLARVACDTFLVVVLTHLLVLSD